MATRKMPAPRRAGTQKVDATYVMAKAGDDPASLLFLISLCDRMVAARGPRRREKKSTRRN